jgi:hypothetical protein
MEFAKGETAIYNDIKPGIIRQKGNIWCLYVGNKKLKESKSKKDALKRVLEEVDIYTEAFLGKTQGRGIYKRKSDG